MLGRWGRYHGLAALPIAGKSDSPIPCNLIDTAIDKEVLTRQMPEHLMAEIDRPILQIPDQSFRAAHRAASCFLLAGEIGRASRRERVCQYVSISVVAVSLTTKRPPTKHTTP